MKQKVNDNTKCILPIQHFLFTCFIQTVAISLWTADRDVLVHSSLVVKSM